MFEPKLVKHDIPHIGSHHSLMHQTIFPMNNSSDEDDKGLLLGF